MTPLERAARALSDGPNPSEWCWEKARAVVEALREPSDDMLEAADEAGPDRAGSTYWRAMIDALLVEGNHG